MAFRLSEHLPMEVSAPAQALPGRDVQGAGLQLFGIPSTPTGWELRSWDLRGALRPQGTEPHVPCKQDVSLQSLTGQQKELFLVHEGNANTILQPPPPINAFPENPQPMPYGEGGRKGWQGGDKEKGRSYSFVAM